MTHLKYALVLSNSLQNDIIIITNRTKNMNWLGYEINKLYSYIFYDSYRHHDQGYIIYSYQWIQTKLR